MKTFGYVVFFVLYAAFVVAGHVEFVQAQAAGGPVLSWEIAVADVAKVTRWRVCLDGVCADVTPTRQDAGSVARFSYQFTAPLSAQAHTFAVKSCNAIACVASDDLAVSLPTKASGLALQ